MALINLSNAYLGFGDHPLLDHTELHIEPGERVCLVGRNGAGKSTLMKILAGEVQLDDGKLVFEKDIVVTRLEQDPPRHIEETVFDYVAEGIAHLADLLKQYHHISLQMQTDYSDELLAKLSAVQSQLEHANGWQFENRIQDTLKLLELAPDKRLCELSGGWVRRAALAREWLGRWLPILMYCCWTNRPTTSTLRRLRGWKICYWISKAVLFLSRTTVPLSAKWRLGLWI